MTVEDLRLAITKNCDIIQAICAFNYALSTETLEELNKIRQQLSTTPRQNLQKLHRMLKEAAEDAAYRYGCRLKPAEFAHQFIQKSRAGLGTPLMSKANIDTLYFKNFAGGHATWKQFSPHLLLFVHCDWTIVGKEFRFHYKLQEATLYEDMAMAYNSAAELLPEVQKARGGRGANLDLKRHALSLRTATLSAFYFVEAFLNGVAFDFCYLNGNDLSEEDKDILLERITLKNKRGLVSFERKATQYLKIMLNLQHPPLTESNCAPLKFLLTEAKELRDAIVHQSPKVQESSGQAEKLKWMLSLQLEQVTKTVDSAVQFVKIVNETMGDKGIPLDWLYPRSPNGLFPPESFQ